MSNAERFPICEKPRPAADESRTRDETGPRIDDRQIDMLERLIASGELHHVTYRNRGTVWEGLWFYRKAEDGFRGYSVAGCVNKSDSDYEAAYRLVSGIGLHVGAYGSG